MQPWTYFYIDFEEGDLESWIIHFELDEDAADVMIRNGNAPAYCARLYCDLYDTYKTIDDKGNFYITRNCYCCCFIF